MSILLIDDHALVRAGVERLLATISDLEVVECSDGRDAGGRHVEAELAQALAI